MGAISEQAKSNKSVTLPFKFVILAFALAVISLLAAGASLAANSGAAGYVLPASPAAHGAAAGRSGSAFAKALHVEVELLAEKSHLLPGTDFWVGLHFKLEPGWHVYWMNPGDAGEPPKVEWHLPAGLSVGPMAWPHPERLQHGRLADYGYEGETLLMVPIRVPAGGNAQTMERPAQISARVKWLVCREICIPGKAQLSLNIPPAGDDIRSVRAALFAKFKERVPKPQPLGWRVAASSQNGNLVLLIYTGRTEKSAQFFPRQTELIENSAAQRAEAVRWGLKLTLKKAGELQKLPGNLDGVLLLASGHAYNIRARLVGD